jgi:hypothetical protein
MSIAVCKLHGDMLQPLILPHWLIAVDRLPLSVLAFGGAQVFIK